MPISGQPGPTDSLNATFSAEGLRRAVRHGSRRTLVAQIGSHVVSLIVLASLYHLIAPRDFGLMGMVLPVIMFLRIFTSLGMNIATVQSRELTPALVSTLFWAHLALGFATALAAVVIAPAVAWFYGEPDVTTVTMALSATSIASALGLQHIALLERNLRLGSAAVSRLVGQFAGGVLAIGMAAAGYGVWALIVQQYVELVALAAVAWCLEPWRPLRPRDGEPVGGTLRFGGYFTASQIVLHLLANIDKILVGFLLGREALGFYSQAFTVMMKPVVVLTTPLSSVMLPALSRSVHDQPHYAQIVLAFQRLLAVAGFPAGVGLMVVARDTMVVLGGEKWAPAGPLLTALAAVILVQGFIMMAGSIFISAGHWRAMLIGLLVMLLVLVPGVLVGLTVGRAWGQPTLGVAWGYSLTTCLVLFLPYMLLCLRLVDVSLVAWAKQLVRPALAAIGMGAVVLAARQVLIGVSWLPPVATLTMEIAAGGAAYLVLAWSEIRWCLDRLRRF
jgi:O-antigen/teichoic acid export membrane protein